MCECDEAPDLSYDELPNPVGLYVYDLDRLMDRYKAGNIPGELILAELVSRYDWGRLYEVGEEGEDE